MTPHLCRPFCCLVLLCAPVFARCDVPVVAVDIAPVHALAARVMEGVGTPGLVLTPGASPHDHALRPSEARLLADAELVIWQGPALMPSMTTKLLSLAGEATVLNLQTVDGVRLLPTRHEAVFAANEVDHHGDEDHPEGEDHADGHHDEDHAEAHHGTDDHDHGPTDPHAWLDPGNAVVWLDSIADALTTLDPENAERYRANATSGAAEISALAADIAAGLSDGGAPSFVVYHDSIQYFETAFGVRAAGALADGDASPPSPARLSAIREAIEAQAIRCVLAEPQYNPRSVNAVAEGTGARVGVIDPLGQDLEPGPALYPTLLSRMAETLKGCAGN